MRSPSLRKKFVIGTTLLILIVGLALSLLISFELHTRFEDELHKRGLSVARYIAEAAEIPLITENSISLQLLVNDYRKLDRDIQYIFIVDPAKKLVAHTFSVGMPRELIRKALAQQGPPGQFLKLDTTDGPLYDISQPIQGGALGTVHIGLYESVIKANVYGVLQRMLPFVLIILMLGIAAAMAFAAAITRPITRLIVGVRRFSAGELNDPIPIDSQDEIGQLAAAFNSMTENLRSTTVSREFMEKLIDSMNDVLIVVSPEGVIQSVNRAYCNLFGYLPDDVIGRNIDELQEQGAPPCMFSAFTQAIKGEPLHGIESTCRTSVGEIVPILYSVAVMNDDEGRPQAVIYAAQNISNLKKVQDALQQKQTELEEINKNLETIVSSRTAELAITNEGLRAEVAERQKKSEELRVARDAAESASRAKSEFLANMSHEMRTPLNSIIGGTEYLDSETYTPDQRRCLTMIRQAGDSLLVLINDLIDLSRIEAGQLEIVRRPFNPLDTVQRAIQMLEQEVERKRLVLNLKCEEGIPQLLMGDHARLQQVLVNLVANAVKFTDSGGSVSLMVQRGPEEKGRVPLTFLVRDTGIGIDPGKLHMIFESFSQADTSITRRYGGSGLGLAISRKLVEAMGGTMQVRSVPGVGSTFGFTISFQLADPPVELIQEQLPEDEAAPVRAAEQAAQTNDTQRILLVDDSPENRDLMRLLLRKLPFVIDEAADGQEALDLFEANSYDLIFMDIQMPLMDGYTATSMIRRIEEQGERKRATIIALTAHAYESDIRKCLDAGCDDHIAKPFKKQTLLGCLANHIRGIEDV